MMTRTTPAISPAGGTSSGTTASRSCSTVSDAAQEARRRRRAILHSQRYHHHHHQQQSNNNHNHSLSTSSSNGSKTVCSSSSPPASPHSINRAVATTTTRMVLARNLADAKVVTEESFGATSPPAFIMHHPATASPNHNDATTKVIITPLSPSQATTRMRSTISPHHIRTGNNSSGSKDQVILQADAATLAAAALTAATAQAILEQWNVNTITETIPFTAPQANDDTEIGTTSTQKVLPMNDSTTITTTTTTDSLPPKKRKISTSSPPAMAGSTTFTTTTATNVAQQSRSQEQRQHLETGDRVLAATSTIAVVPAVRTAATTTDDPIPSVTTASISHEGDAYMTLPVTTGLIRTSRNDTAAAAPDAGAAPDSAALNFTETTTAANALAVQGLEPTTTTTTTTTAIKSPRPISHHVGKMKRPSMSNSSTTSSNNHHDQVADDDEHDNDEHDARTVLLDDDDDVHSSASSPRRAIHHHKKIQIRYDPTLPMERDQLTAWRREARRVRNRESAATSRLRVRSRITGLEAEVEDWKAKYTAAVQQLKQWEEPKPTTTTSTTTNNNNNSRTATMTKLLEGSEDLCSLEL